NDLALEAARQIQVAREGFAGVIVAFALGPARVITRILAVIRLSRVARSATEFAAVVVATVRMAMRCRPVAFAVVLARGTTTAAASLGVEPLVVARVVVARVRVHATLVLCGCSRARSSKGVSKSTPNCQKAPR